MFLIDDELALGNQNNYSTFNKYNGAYCKANKNTSLKKMR